MTIALHFYNMAIYLFYIIYPSQCTSEISMSQHNLWCLNCSFKHTSMRRVEILKFTLMRVIIEINIKLNHHPLSLVCNNRWSAFVLPYIKNQTKQTAFKRRGDCIASLYRDDISVTQINISQKSHLPVSFLLLTVSLSLFIRSHS